MNIQSLKNERRSGSFRRKLLLLLPLLVVLLLYRLTGEVAQAGEQTWIVKIPLDDKITLVKAFIHPYYYWYVFSFGSCLLFLVSSKFDTQYFRFAGSLIVVLLLANVVYLVFPTYVPRPVVEGDDLSALMIRYLYRTDPPYNCLPSIHVAYSVIAGLAWDGWLRSQAFFWKGFSVLARIVNVGIVLLISLSTLFTRQHHIPDVAAGLALALAVWFVLPVIYRKMAARRHTEKQKRPI